jgi:ferrous iron transport protein A
MRDESVCRARRRCRRQLKCREAMSKPMPENAKISLDHAAIGDALVVHRIHPPQGAPEWARWLEEIGFLVGERVMLMARALPGGDPLVIRIGQSTFALRRAEAACVQVTADSYTDSHARTGAQSA